MSARRSKKMMKGKILPDIFSLRQNAEHRAEHDRQVFHYTDTVRLPWILLSGELCPGANRIGGYPVDVLWATTDARGDRTASSARDAWRDDLARLVRFTLRPEDFEPWRQVIARYPAWTRDHVALLEHAARDRGVVSFECWHCRPDPLPLNRVVRIETRTWRGPWQVLEDRKVTTNHATSDGRPGDAGEAAIVIGDRVYRSVRSPGLSGGMAYTGTSELV